MPRRAVSPQGAQYSVVGSACGLVGQGIGNSLMLIKRKLLPGHAEDEVRIFLFFVDEKMSACCLLFRRK